MKTNIKLIALVGILLFGSLTTALAATNNQKEITYYMMSFTELPGSKSFGCGEFLVPVKKKIKNPNLKEDQMPGLENLLDFHFFSWIKFKNQKSQLARILSRYI